MSDQGAAIAVQREPGPSLAEYRHCGCASRGKGQGAAIAVQSEPIQILPQSRHCGFFFRRRCLQFSSAIALVVCGSIRQRCAVDFWASALQATFTVAQNIPMCLSVFFTYFAMAFVVVFFAVALKSAARAAIAVSSFSEVACHSVAPLRLLFMG